MHNNEKNNKPLNLFVYGTLAPSRPNEHILSNIGGTWKKASIKGKLKEGGWGAEMGYPGIVIDENGEKVKGFVFTSQNLSGHWAQLDKFEGEDYERALTQAVIDHRTILDVYVYVLKII